MVEKKGFNLIMKKNVCTMVVVAFLVTALNAQADLVRLNDGSFTPNATAITFSEFPLNTQNPSYTIGSQIVDFGGYFLGGLGTPTIGATLALDPLSSTTSIVNDYSNPTSPVLSGTPQFNGPVAVWFCEDVAAVGLDGGYFNAIGGTTIAAYDREGNLLGSVTNSIIGIEFFGLGDSSGDAVIAGIQFYITGNEPAGYAIDNLTFAYDRGGYNPEPVSTVPEPSTLLLLSGGLFGLVTVARRRMAKE